MKNEALPWSKGEPPPGTTVGYWQRRDREWFAMVTFGNDGKWHLLSANDVPPGFTAQGHVDAPDCWLRVSE